MNAESVHHEGRRLDLGGRHRHPHKVVSPGLAAVGVQLGLLQRASRTTNDIRQRHKLILGSLRAETRESVSVYGFTNNVSI